jgi:glucose dehydrogenase
VTLDPNEQDIYGVPLPRLAYRLDDYVQAGLAAARAAHAEIFGRLGATGIEYRDAPEGAGHIMGTARMGNDPKSSWSTAIFAATITLISSSSARPCSPPAPRLIPR